VVFGQALAMAAFAANSLFCRQALGAASIDAAGFTLVRLLSGAVALAVISMAQRKAWRGLFRPDTLAALALFGYATAFSFAYRELTAGTGALLLFGAVQATMIGFGLVQGERSGALEWVGFKSPSR